MTTVGLLCPGHAAEDDYARIGTLLDGVRLPVVRADALGAREELAGKVERLRLVGAESVLWASASGSFARGWEGAHEQVRALALAAGLPSSSTAFAFVHALRELGAARVAVASTYPADVTAQFAAFLGAAGVEVLAGRAGLVTAGVGGGDRVLELAVRADHPAAECVLIPDTALATAAHLEALERELGKPVLTASQATVWEGLRLAERRAHGEELGTLFAKRE
ncbi:decarboxylase [Streptomyces sp. NPDC001941]|uniref:maleate cis-trans isomerase family protein n=1 Tax=Streptomyces sp. NPDC001941 TaxID=3154659 RepID=UPI00332D0CB4